MHADHIEFQIEMTFYGKALFVCSHLPLTDLNLHAGLYVALSISHLTILHARRARKWKFGYQLFTSLVLFLDITIVCFPFFNVIIPLTAALSMWEWTFQLPRSLILAQLHLQSSLQQRRTVE